MLLDRQFYRVGQTPTAVSAVPLQKNSLVVDSQKADSKANCLWFCERDVEVLKELKVFVADDSDADIQQLQRALSSIAGCTLVGKAAGKNEATELIRSLQPDVIILDISMPHREGINVLREIRNAVPQATIIIFTADPSVVLQEVCLDAGADHYLYKTQIQDLIDICSSQSAKI